MILSSNVDSCAEQHDNVNITEHGGNDLNFQEHSSSNDVLPSSSSSTQIDKTTLYNYEETAGGTKYWIPIVDDILKPKIGTHFDSIEDAVHMYASYAEKAGFDIRSATSKMNKRSGKLQYKYFVCNKEGLPETVHLDTLMDGNKKRKRNSNLHRSGCKACVKFKVVKGTSKFLSYFFEEKHNHSLLNEANVHLSRKRRQVDLFSQTFIHKMSTSKIGATRAHTLLSGFKGGFDLVGGTKVDFKNYKRDLNCVVSGSDSHMLVTKMENRKKCVPNFSFDYQCNEGMLSALFWADETAKCHYDEFGDVLSFDATYSTNKYNMIFVPFTGIDNHNNCVTFAAGLLSGETVEQYKWLLDAFLQAFGKQPRMVVTDQDPSMKIALASVFPNSIHRLYMWHITKKLSGKLTPSTNNDTDFKKQFHKLVWNINNDPKSFEEKWHSLIHDYKLENNKWLSDMFEIRGSWIPSYFKEVQLCGLMRTTSRSESENSFFGNFLDDGMTLTIFMNAYETAIEKQRHTQSILDHQTETSRPKAKTPLQVEEHAWKIYTRTIFILVQNEIYQSIWTCSQSSVTTLEEDVEICIVKEKVKQNVNNNNEGDHNDNQHPFIHKDFKVTFNKSEQTFTCSCMYYITHGLLCRHIFCIMKLHDIEEIPSKYILRRWRKGIIPLELLKKRYWVGEANERRHKLTNELYSSMADCVSVLGENMDGLEAFAKKFQALKTEIVEGQRKETKKTKEQMIQSLLGVSKPDLIDIQNPNTIRNKGCGAGKRIIGAKEKAIDENSRPKRMCRTCHQLGHHDSRTCEIKKKLTN